MLPFGFCSTAWISLQAHTSHDLFFWTSFFHKIVLTSDQSALWCTYAPSKNTIVVAVTDVHVAIGINCDALGLVEIDNTQRIHGRNTFSMTDQDDEVCSLWSSSSVFISLVSLYAYCFDVNWKWCLFISCSASETYFVQLSKIWTTIAGNSCYRCTSRRSWKPALNPMVILICLEKWSDISCSYKRSAMMETSGEKK